MLNIFEWLLSNKIKTIFFISIIVGGFNFYADHQFSLFHTNDSTYNSSLDSEPIQVDGTEDSFSFWKDRKFRIMPLATFDITGLVLSKEHYRLDTEAELAEYDFIFSWKRMSDHEVIKDMSFSQRGRFGYWSWTSEPSIPLSEISSSISNMHLIPASAKIESAIANIKIGQVVQLKGKLVSVEGAGGYKWISSLSRTDTGRGACEVFYVEKVGQ